jgi:hypothetical protein
MRRTVNPSGFVDAAVGNNSCVELLLFFLFEYLLYGTVNGLSEDWTFHSF